MLGLGKSALPALMIAGGFASPPRRSRRPVRSTRARRARSRAPMLDLQTRAAARPSRKTPPKRAADAVKLLQRRRHEARIRRAAPWSTARRYVLWMAQPNMASGKTTRGALGFVTDTAASFDLVAGIDSAFTVVETRIPSARRRRRAYRQQKPWVDLVNQAIELANAGQIGLRGRARQAVASALEERARTATSSSRRPRPKKNQPKEAIAYYKQAIAAAKDTSAAMADTQAAVAG